MIAKVSVKKVKSVLGTNFHYLAFKNKIKSKIYIGHHSKTSDFDHFSTISK